MGVEPFRVFLSGVSSEFKQARSLLASDLRARGLEVKIQKDFVQGTDSTTTMSKLDAYVAGCDAVVLLIGSRSGSFPPEDAAEPFGDLVPEGFGRLSYTQWELLLAEHHQKRQYRYVASAEYVADRPAADSDDPVAQAGFKEWLFEVRGLDRSEFTTSDQLRWLVLRERWPDRSRPTPVSLPYPSLGALFEGRDNDVARVAASLEEGADATAIVGRVLHGLGGVGKTRLAVEYAWQHFADYTALVFVAAEKPETLAQNLAALASPGVLDLGMPVDADQQTQVAAVVDWLVKNPGWLLIVDNIDTTEAAHALTELLPRLRGGQVLITGRLSEWGADVQTLELDVLDLDAAAAFLDARCTRRVRPDTDSTDVVELAEELGGLAMALEQAGAYINQLRLGFADYLDEWRQRQAEVRAWFDEDLMNYSASVAVTWATTIEQLNTSERALLRILTWMAPDPLPVAAITTAAGDEILNATATTLDTDTAPVTVREALAGLATFSMIRWDPNDDAVEVHRVVQEVMRDRIDPDDTQWIAAALGMLDAHLDSDPTDVTNWPTWDPMRPHITTVVAHGDEAHVAEPTYRLMGQLGRLLDKKALYAQAEPLFRRAIDICEAALGPDHPDVAVWLNNLASLLKATNRLEEAEPLYRRAISIGEASLGPDHPDVAVWLSNLASLLQATNRLEEAEPLSRRHVVIFIEFTSLTGHQHPYLQQAVGNYIRLLQEIGRTPQQIREALAGIGLSVDIEPK